jgi:hypothetical protein
MGFFARVHFTTYLAEEQGADDSIHCVSFSTIHQILLSASLLAEGILPVKRIEH